MAKHCILCDELTIFYVWISSANLDISKLPIRFRDLKIPGVVCIHCFERFNLRKDISELDYPCKEKYEGKYFGRYPIEVNSYSKMYDDQNNW